MDWLAFFTDHGIDYVTRGPNVKRGNVNIACPFCGDDPSHHMGVALEIEAWGCWRGSNHKGKKAHNLIKALLGCSFRQARIIADQYSAADPESLDEAIDMLLQEESTGKQKQFSRNTLRFRPEFKRIKSTGTTKRFFDYLERRHFNDVRRLVKMYNLRASMVGTWKDRIIIPIYQNDQLVSWTSRAIGKTFEAPRYLALSEEDGGLVNVFHTLWNWDNIIEGGDLLFVVEGPFDALKLDYYGYDFWDDGIHVQATCTFGTSMSDLQAMMIAEVAKKFKKTVLLYDPEATEAIFIAKEKLQHTDVEVGFLPENIEDPGALTKKQARVFIRDAIRKYFSS